MKNSPTPELVQSLTSSKYLKVMAAAKYAGVGYKTFRKWVVQFGLPEYHVGTLTLYNCEEIDKFIQHNGKIPE